MSWPTWVEAQLDAIKVADQWRVNRSFDAFGPAGLLAGQSVVSYASNDYLGLSFHPDVMAAAHAAIDRWGAGSTASRLIVGTRPCHEELEHELARVKHSEAALVTSTGFSANLSVLTVLGGEHVTVFSDELNHASIIDGCRLSRSPIVVYRHNDLDQLMSLLAVRRGLSLVVTDSVFSMDGDVADLEAMIEVCTSHDALLMLDEAHGVLGPHLERRVEGVVRVGTLSKTLGSLGGWIAASRLIIDLIINRARPFIFTTALTPADTAAALAALHIVESAEGDVLRAELRTNIDRLRAGHPSPILPVILGDESSTLAASRALLCDGIFVPAIRPPTVPTGTSRLRVALSAAHTPDMIGHLLQALDALGIATG